MGIDANKVDPVPLGIGANHAVYKYETPEGAQKVIKLTRPGGTLSTMNRGYLKGKYQRKSKNTSSLTFPKLNLKKTQSTKLPVKCKDVVEGEPISDKNYTPGIKNSFRKLLS